ncbi:MAG: reverse transcriptase domain-containing protein [Candidatus Woesearchaeota archaeon]
MMRHSSLWKGLCSYENLEVAFNNARKHKTLKPYIINFEKNLKENLLKLQLGLLFHIYGPQPLTTFVIQDPKTRKISRSDFRDRIVHHALCNVIEPIFNKSFIFDSYANRIGKGCLKAIKRFGSFKRKVSRNKNRKCFVLKADIRHYFETVNHNILLYLIKKKIKDKNVLWLIKIILSNYNSKKEGVGMPLGNLTSQFFANLYLNELDQYVKHKLKIKYYIRYVDDFVILHTSKDVLEEYKREINNFLKRNLELELHPDKSKVLPLEAGISFLGFRIFYYHLLVKKKNVDKFERKFQDFKKRFAKEDIGRDEIIDSFQGWMAYIMHGNTYKYRRHLTKLLNHTFPAEVPPQNKKQENLEKAVAVSEMEFSTQKTLKLFKEGMGISQIGEKRGIKEATAWKHLAKLIEQGLLSVYDVLPQKKIRKIQFKIKKEAESLEVIKARLGNSFSYAEIRCVIASVKHRNRKRSISSLVKWYRKAYCLRKCSEDASTKRACWAKLKEFSEINTFLQLPSRKFLKLIRKDMDICCL